MATVTSDPGSAQPNTVFFDVDVDNVTTANATTYAWETYTYSGSGVVDSRITLIGSFTYDGSGNPSGDVVQILVDGDGDGDTDLTIAYDTYIAGILDDLVSENPTDFWGAAFFQDDTITLGGSSVDNQYYDFFLGGTGTESNDTVTITGYGDYGGDARYAEYNAKAGGNDDFTVTSVDPTKVTTVVGDFRGHGSNTVYGGNDSFVDTTAATTGTSVKVNFIGDVEFQDTGTVYGGDDTMTANERRSTLVGDVDFFTDGGNVLYGGADTIYGGDEVDLIYGEFRTVSTSGGSTSHTVYGGNDQIYAGAGDDIIYGEGPGEVGDDVVLLFGGDDLIYGGTGNDTIYGGSGNDTIVGGNDDDHLFGGDGSDTFYGGSGIDTVDFSDSVFSVSLALGTGGVGPTGSATSGGVTEALYYIEAAVGTSLNDTLTGNDLNNTLEGGGGNDTIDGGAGLDIASYVNATGGITVDLAATGLQAIGGGQGSDTLSNIEGVLGSDFDDTIFGSTGNNYIDGGDGNDTILTSSATSGFPNPGGDTFYGGAGQDIVGFALTGVGQSNLGLGHQFYGGTEDIFDAGDTFVFETFGANYEVTIYGDGTSVGTFVQGSTGTTIAELYGFENVSAGSGNDTITATDFADHTIWGNAGDDTIYSGSGEDELYGGDDADVIYGGSDNDTIYGGNGNDTLDGGSYSDEIYGDGGNDTVWLTLDGYYDLADTADGGSGTDTAAFRYWDSSFVFTEGGATDTVSTAPFGTTYTATLTSFELLEIAGLVMTSAELLAGNFIYGNYSGETLQGTTGSDIIFGGQHAGTSNDGADYINASAGDDFIQGGGQDDTIVGGSGGDFIHGGNGIDEASYANSGSGVSVNLLTGAGALGDAQGDTLVSIENLFGSLHGDTLTGDDGDNSINGSNGDDTLSGGLGTNTLEGGNGIDTFIGGAGIDFINGGGGTGDTVDYTASNAAVTVGINNGGTVSGGYAEGDTVSTITENIVGSAFNDEITGNTLQNVLTGGGGADTLNASSNSDTIFGGSGDDVMFGSRGADSLYGGSGSDTASYTNSDARVIVDLDAGTATGSGHGAGDTLDSIENVVGSFFNDIITGDGGSNVLEGYNGIDTIDGAGGDDTLIGGSGVDYLIGGIGNDTLSGSGGFDRFIFNQAGFGQDVITDFTNNQELMDMRGSGLTYGDLTITQVGSDKVITVNGTSDSITLLGVTTLIDINDFIF